MEDPGAEDQGREVSDMTAREAVPARQGAPATQVGRAASHPGTAWVVLAAGMGTRMRSNHPKVLHRLCGRPMGAFFLEEARRWQPGQVVVVTGHQAARVEQELGAWAQRLGVAISFVRQEPQRGTGDAVRWAMTALAPGVDEVAVSYADVPLLSAGTMVELVAQRRRHDAALAILTAVLDDPTGYGRVLRAPDEPDRVTGVVEERDASPEQRAIREANVGVYAFRRDALEAALKALRPDNAQGEYYLTDTVGWLASRGERVVAVPVADPLEVTGVNDRRQLRELERAVCQRVAERLLASGVTLRGGVAPLLDPWVEVGPDSVIDATASLLGTTRVGRGCEIGPGAVLVDCELGDDVSVEGVRLVACKVGSGATIGPGAWIPPGSVIAAGARIGSGAHRWAHERGGL